MHKRVLLFLLCLLPLGPAFAETGGITLAQRPVAEMIKEIGIDQKLGQQLPLTLEFKDEQGEPVQLGKYFGSKPVILNLVYFRCPMLCSLVLEGLTKALRPLRLNPGKDFQIVTVSIDPSDTPEKAAEKKQQHVKAYARPGADQAWHFLTGTQPSIDALAKAIGFRYVADPKSGQFAHAGGIMVATPEGKLSSYFYGIEYSSRDLRLALVEASKGQIGSWADQLLLLCFHYDPMTGKYGFVIMNVLRISAFLTAFGMALAVLWMLRQEKASKAGVV